MFVEYLEGVKITIERAQATSAFKVQQLLIHILYAGIYEQYNIYIYIHITVLVVGLYNLF